MTMTANPTTAPFLPGPAGMRRALDDNLRAAAEAATLDRLRAAAVSLGLQAEALYAAYTAASVQNGALRAENEYLRQRLAAVTGTEPGL